MATSRLLSTFNETIPVLSLPWEREFRTINAAKTLSGFARLSFTSDFSKLWLDKQSAREYLAGLSIFSIFLSAFFVIWAMLCVFWFIKGYERFGFLLGEPFHVHRDTEQNMRDEPLLENDEVERSNNNNGEELILLEQNGNKNEKNKLVTDNAEGAPINSAIDSETEDSDLNNHRHAREGDITR